MLHLIQIKYLFLTRGVAVQHLSSLRDYIPGTAGNLNLQARPCLYMETRSFYFIILTREVNGLTVNEAILK